MLAQAAASLDTLSGGRLELALGAGGLWNAIASMGAPRRSPGEAVDALREAISIIRAAWDTKAPGTVQFEGRHYGVDGLAPGPAPSHDIEIWLGAYQPRMLRLVAAAGDGWLPSLPNLSDPRLLGEGNTIIDDAAAEAGRSPRDIRRLLNLGRPTPAEMLADFALTHGISVFIVLVASPYEIEGFAAETAPAVRDLVAAERGSE